jgi:VanZ family protein
MIAARRAWGPAVTWAVLIFVLSSIPGKTLSPVQLFAGIDKVAHAGVYAVLGATVLLAARRTWALSGRASVLLAAALAVGYGITDELHQLLVPGRSADAFDVVADGLGALFGAFVAERRPWRTR